VTPATINAVGFVAGLCGIVGFVPQLFKIVRDKDAREVSRAMYAITTLGFVLWVTFGVLNHSWPVIASNSVMLILAATILGLTLKYGKGPPSR
jgi:MtN3 and saliva related transmembrane protein